MAGELEIIGDIGKLSEMIDAIPERIQKGTDTGIRKVTTEARRLLRQQMSFKGDETPSDMLGRRTGYTRGGARKSTFREDKDIVGKVYVASKGYETPTPGNIAYINVAGAPTRTRGGALPARDFFQPVREAVRGFAAGMVDDAVAAELAKPLLEAI